MKFAGSIALALALVGAGAQAQSQAQTQTPQRPDLFANAPKFDPAIEVGFAVLNVADMKKSRMFYELLGLTVTLTAVAHNGIPGTPENKDMPMTLFQTATGSSASGLHLVQADGPIVLGNGWNRLGIRVADAVGVCKALAAAGMPCVRDPNVSRRGNATMAVAWTRDPDGRLLELVQFSAG